MPLMQHKDGRRIAASSDRVDALLAQGFTIVRPEKEEIAQTPSADAPKKKSK